MANRYPLVLNSTTIQELQAADTLLLAPGSAALALKLPNINQPATVSATASTGTINYDVTTQAVLYYTTNASGNFTLNFRGSSGTTLASLLATGDSVCISFLCTNGSTVIG
jgi:hypothetical protein